jgi:hypothetical protein
MTNRAREERLLLASIARLRAGIMAVVCGLLSGTALLVATVWLIVRGGPRMGQHLQLLGHYFPGYSVTPVGAVVGFFWAALTGAALGWLIAWLYNLVAGRRIDLSGG